MCPAPQLEERVKSWSAVVRPVSELRDEQLGDHDERCSVRVDFAPSFHEFDDRSWGVQKDEALAKEMQVHDIAWKPVGRGVGEERVR
jgi:hypothetical protein